MPRESIEMTREELRDLLAATRWVVLGTLSSDGGPEASLAPSALEGDALCFAVPHGSDAHRNIERDPRVCCATDEYPSYYEIRGATLHGVAVPAQSAALAEPGHEVFSVGLDDALSFDFSKIQGRV